MWQLGKSHLFCRCASLVSSSLKMKGLDFQCIRCIGQDQVRVNHRSQGEGFLHEWDELNKNKPLWMQKSEDVTNGEHVFFYKCLLLQIPLQPEE